MKDQSERRRQMVADHVARRGVRDPRVLDALETVPREVFVPDHLVELAYEDAPVPLEHGQVVSRPVLVGWMAEALNLRPGDRVLEVGTGSGYTAAVLSRIVASVYTIERYPDVAERARTRVEGLGYGNVFVRSGDGSLGWPDQAPFDAILVEAGAPQIPQALREQLAVGGQLLVPVGETPRTQRLLRVVRLSESRFAEQDLGAVRFVPLTGEAGFGEKVSTRRAPRPLPTTPAQWIEMAAEPFRDIDSADLQPILDRIGDARVVLLGEATHGTCQFYRMRARITQALVERRGFNLVAVEADWPDAARIDHHVRDLDRPPATWKAFARFPTWMWRNAETAAFVEWLRGWNGARPRKERASFHGLDLYSLFTSIEAVLDYLDDVDPEVANIARERYGCLMPWQDDPATYGRAAVTGAYAGCEDAVAAMLTELLARREDYAAADGDRFLEAAQNARVVANAEQYYRVMYYGARASWNLRDRHMFDTLQTLLGARGPGAKAVVWAHNSHIGDARATEMGGGGELNIGQLCREAYGDEAYLVGFGTDHGTVAAASFWDGAMEIKHVRPALRDSYEGLCHQSGVRRFFLPLRDADEALREQLLGPRLNRAIGVIYRPETELQSHYFQSVLPRQFDEYIWFDETSAVRPLSTVEVGPDLPETWPFGY